MSNDSWSYSYLLHLGGTVHSKSTDVTRLWSSHKILEISWQQHSWTVFQQWRTGPVTLADLATFIFQFGSQPSRWAWLNTSKHSLSFLSEFRVWITSPCPLHFSECFLDVLSGFPVKTNSSESRLHSDTHSQSSVPQTVELSAIYGKKRSLRGSSGGCQTWQCIPKKCACSTGETGPSLISMLCRTWAVKFWERSQCSRPLPQETVYFPFALQTRVSLMQLVSSQC